MKTVASRLAGQPDLAQWALLAGLSVACVAALHAAGLPAAFFLGPMGAGVVMGVNGASIRVPRALYCAAQAVMGTFIASAITASILGSFLAKWPVILGVVFATIAASSFLGYLMSRAHVMPGTTSVWGASPGAGAAMIIMAEEFGADARLVAFMHYFRVICVAGLASVIAALWTHAQGGAHPPVDWLGPVHWHAFGVTLLLAGLCAVAGPVLHIPSGPMLLALLSGSALNLTTQFEIELPKALLAGTYALLGWSVGLKFTPEILRHAVRVMPQILSSVVALIAFCGGLAYLLTRTLGIDPLTAYLATSPGGMDSIAIIAASTPVDVPFVMALQTIRFLVIILAGPWVVRLVARHMEAAATTGRG